MSQADDLLFALKRLDYVDPWIALMELGIYRCAARIKDLRDEGHDIETEIVKTAGGARVARYWLKGKK